MPADSSVRVEMDKEMIAGDLSCFFLPLRTAAVPRLPWTPRPEDVEDERGKAT